MKRLIFVTVACAFVAAPAIADLYSGTLNYSDGGIVATGAWAATGTSITWLVTPVYDADLNPDLDFYRYTYTFTVPSKALSHFILEVSDTFDNWGIDEDGLVNATLDPETLAAYLDTYYGTGSVKPNPGMPGPIYGLKFEGFAEDTTWVWSFDSLREPVWGDFYAVDGAGAYVPWVYAYNLGFVVEPDVEDGHIAVPDTTMIPAPAGIVLGILGLGCAGLKLRKVA